MHMWLMAGHLFELSRRKKKTNFKLLRSWTKFIHSTNDVTRTIKSGERKKKFFFRVLSRNFFLFIFEIFKNQISDSPPQYVVWDRQTHPDRASYPNGCRGGPRPPPAFRSNMSISKCVVVRFRTDSCESMNHLPQNPN